MYREAPATLFDALASKLAPFGFVPLGREYLHRKTWNTNRGVVLARLERDLASTIGALVVAARAPLKHSWWAQLGLQIVLETDAPPPASTLERLVDPINHQDILVQSVFAVGPDGTWTEARTWGQVITGKYQDAIASVLAERARSRHP